MLPSIGRLLHPVRWTVLAFLARRWQSAIELRLLFWRDMLAVGTLINLLASLVALLMLVQKVRGEWAVLVHLAPLPYNLFLLAAVWRSPERTPIVVLLSAIWFVLMIAL